jgi:hypothetical protein
MRKCLLYHSSTLEKLLTSDWKAFKFIVRVKFLYIPKQMGEDYLEMDQPETRISYGGHVC